MVFLGGCILVVMFVILLASKPFHRGYVTRTRTLPHYIEKTIGSVTVRFYSMGEIGNSKRELRDGLAEGVYAIISSDEAFLLSHTSSLFDEVEMESAERWVATVKKKGIFMGEPEMKTFLDQFDEALASDIPGWVG